MPEVDRETVEGEASTGAFESRTIGGVVGATTRRVVGTAGADAVGTAGCAVVGATYGKNFGGLPCRGLSPAPCSPAVAEIPGSAAVAEITRPTASMAVTTEAKTAVLLARRVCRRTVSP